MYSSLFKVTERRYLLGLFLNGLKDEVRAELKLQSFHTLDELMDLAELVESRNQLLSRCGSKPTNRFGFPSSSKLPMRSVPVSGIG